MPRFSVTVLYRVPLAHLVDVVDLWQLDAVGEREAETEALRRSIQKYNDPAGDFIAFAIPSAQS